MSEQELTGEKLAQAWYNEIVKAAKRISPEPFEGYDKCTGIILIGFRGEEDVFMHRVGRVSEVVAIELLKHKIVEDVFKELAEGRPSEQ